MMCNMVHETLLTFNLIIKAEQNGGLVMSEKLVNFYHTYNSYTLILSYLMVLGYHIT